MLTFVGVRLLSVEDDLAQVSLFIAGIVAVSLGHEGAPPIFILAALTLLPGCYAITHLVGVYRRWPGYYDHLSGLSDLELV